MAAPVDGFAVTSLLPRSLLVHFARSNGTLNTCVGFEVNADPLAFIEGKKVEQAA